MPRETTVNIRVTEEERERWRAVAPDGRLSKWLRFLAEREVKRNKK